MLNEKWLPITYDVYSGGTSESLSPDKLPKDTFDKRNTPRVYISLYIFKLPEKAPFY
ncbi:hypothetical protein [Thermodesulfatator autotrophicus]|uniref:hypothetical protein n=1 Tax=Thermodesulfatator autotrophicus TaxID=1795632 RepID=UPI0012FAE2C5|nr:hypothetical protein [Thermodesulfatator autotrophicus]